MPVYEYDALDNPWLSRIYPDAVPIHLSAGNSKIGEKLPNISLPPIRSCVRGVPCSRHKECYALKAYTNPNWPSVRKAWDENYQSYLSDPETYFMQIHEALARKRDVPSDFRWHVAGDIPDMRYIEGMFMIADLWPRTRFLCFTKHLDFLMNLIRAGRTRPPNLIFIASMWPHWGDERIGKYFFRAWLWDDFDPEERVWDLERDELRIPNPYVCPGSCPGCMFCWNPRSDVIFHKH